MSEGSHGTTAIVRPSKTRNIVAGSLLTNPLGRVSVVTDAAQLASSSSSSDRSTDHEAPEGGHHSRLAWPGGKPWLCGRPALLRRADASASRLSGPKPGRQPIHGARTSGERPPGPGHARCFIAS